MLDNKGYVRITDFGISKLYSSRNSNETSGTPGYMSPEVMKCQNHTAAVDFFALGVMGYEFMLGKRPYIGKSRKEIKEQMLSRQASIKLCSIPDGWSEESADFINKLLMRKPEERLGFRGVQELKEHPWLKYFPWSELLAKSIEAPFVPERKDNFDKKTRQMLRRLKRQYPDGHCADGLQRFQPVAAAGDGPNFFHFALLRNLAHKLAPQTAGSTGHQCNFHGSYPQSQGRLGLSWSPSALKRTKPSGWLVK